MQQEEEEGIVIQCKVTFALETDHKFVPIINAFHAELH